MQKGRQGKEGGVWRVTGKHSSVTTYFNTTKVTGQKYMYLHTTIEHANETKNIITFEAKNMI